MFIKPAPGRAVRNPLARRSFVPETGMEVSDHADWHTLLRQGDIVLAEPPSNEEAPPTPSLEQEVAS